MSQAPALAKEIFCVASVGENKSGCFRIQINGKLLVSSVSRPADSREIHGFFSYVGAKDRPIFAAYFARERRSSAEAPDYKSGLYLLLGDQLFPCASGETMIELRSGLFRRRFSISCPNQKSITIEYPWPFYRELAQRVFGDPFNFVSRDFLFEALKLVEAYATN